MYGVLDDFKKVVISLIMKALNEHFIIQDKWAQDLKNAGEAIWTHSSGMREAGEENIKLAGKYGYQHIHCLNKSSNGSRFQKKKKLEQHLKQWCS